MKSSSSSSMPESKDICVMYFGEEPVDKMRNIWKCKCGKLRKSDVKVNGYTNLMGHIKDKHPDMNELLALQSGQATGILDNPTNQKQTMLQFLIDPKSNDIYKWIDWVVMDELELSFCEQERSRQYTNLSSLCTKTLKKYVLKLSKAVQRRVKERVAGCHCFALIYDGWTEDNTHFIGMYCKHELPTMHIVANYLLLCSTGMFAAIPPKDASSEAEIMLLAFQPLPDESQFTAQNHYEFIVWQLAEYGLCMKKLVCLIGDNCSTNTATAKLCKVPMFGSRSHRLNLAVEKYIAKFLGEEERCIGELMSKLSNLKEAGKLRQKTHLRPVKKNVTRWLGTIKMFDRFKQLQGKFDEKAVGIAKLMPTYIQQETISKHMQTLHDLKSVTLSMQSESLTIAESEELFMSIITEFPAFDFAEYLGPNAHIIENKSFESALIKIQNAQESQLTDAESTAVKLLEVKPIIALEEEGENQLSFVDRAKKKMKLKKPTSTFIDTRFLIPTSNHVERLFSMSKRVFSLKRRSLLPRNLEALVLLKANRRLWTYPWFQL